MIGLYRESKPGVYEDVSIQSGIGPARKTALGLAALSWMSTSMDGSTWR